MKDRPKRRAPYERVIKECLKQIKREDLDPRHVEGIMRGQYGTLDHLDRETFVSECRIAARWKDELGEADLESVARSHGM